MIQQFIPVPPVSAFQIGPLTIHFYAICIIIGLLIAWVWATKRAVARGANQDTFELICLIMVISGFVGARAYHVITENRLYFGSGRAWWEVFAIWNGGIGIIGGITGGALGAYLMCRWKKVDFASFADAVAPTLMVAQAIGRVGNWFNQEAFGKPTTLPWAVEIEPAHRPAGYAQYETFHPTFLSEGIWNLIGCAVLLWIEKKFSFGRGKLFVSYVLWYTFGRFFIELIRIDTVNVIGGLRINDWFALAAFLIAAVVMVWLIRNRPGMAENPFGAPAPSADEEGDSTPSPVEQAGEADVANGDTPSSSLRGGEADVAIQQGSPTDETDIDEPIQKTD
jgi:prolipoprotein diacylglyceryl transferase